MESSFYFHGGMIRSDIWVYPRYRKQYSDREVLGGCKWPCSEPDSLGMTIADKSSIVLFVLWGHKNKGNVAGQGEKEEKKEENWGCRQSGEAYPLCTKDQLSWARRGYWTWSWRMISQAAYHDWVLVIMRPFHVLSSAWVFEHKYQPWATYPPSPPSSLVLRWSDGGHRKKIRLFVFFFFFFFLVWLWRHRSSQI